eukprot:g3041.t1
MLRYDLMQQVNDPTRFVVYELCASAAAMAAHEDRRADGVLRAALASMEARPRKAIDGTGRIMGAVIVSECFPYETAEMFHADRPLHLVDPDGPFGWKARRGVLYGWRVARVVVDHRQAGGGGGGGGFR